MEAMYDSYARIIQNRLHAELLPFAIDGSTERDRNDYVREVIKSMGTSGGVLGCELAYHFAKPHARSPRMLPGRLEKRSSSSRII